MKSRSQWWDCTFSRTNWVLKFSCTQNVGLCNGLNHKEIWFTSQLYQFYISIIPYAKHLRDSNIIIRFPWNWLMTKILSKFKSHIYIKTHLFVIVFFLVINYYQTEQHFNVMRIIYIYEQVLSIISSFSKSWETLKSYHYTCIYSIL